MNLVEFPRRVLSTTVKVHLFKLYVGQFSVEST